MKVFHKVQRTCVLYSLALLFSFNVFAAEGNREEVEVALEIRGYSGSITNFISEKVTPEFEQRLTDLFHNRKDIVLLPLDGVDEKMSVFKSIEAYKGGGNQYGCGFYPASKKRTNQVGERELDFVILSGQTDEYYRNNGVAEARKTAAQKYSTIKDKKIVTNSPFWFGNCAEYEFDAPRRVYFFDVERTRPGPVITSVKTSTDDKSRDNSTAKKPTSGHGPVLTLTRVDHSQEDAKRAKAAADAKKRADEENKKAVAAAKKRESDEAAAKAVKEEKQKQWCMADRARLSYCGCSQYNPAKGGACLK